MIRDKFQVEPSIEYYDAPVVVDNVTFEIIAEDGHPKEAEKANHLQHSPVKIDRLDHLVLTVRDVEATCAFYSRVLGMKLVTFAEDRQALSFGRQKLNLHLADAPISPHAASSQTHDSSLGRVVIS